MESTAGEDAVDVPDLTTQALEYDRNLVNKAVAGFEEMGSKFESSTVSAALPSRNLPKISTEKSYGSVS